jgi:hypothetical protein
MNTLFSRSANNPYSDYYDPRWRNYHNLSWHDQAIGNSAPQCHELHYQANSQFNNQAVYPLSNFHPPYQQWQSSPYCAEFEDNWQPSSTYWPPQQQYQAEPPAPMNSDL